MTAIKSNIEEVVDSRSKVLLCQVLGVKPAGYAQALEREKQELQRERIRLWYVATTRARELLVVPRFADALPNSSWGRLVDLDLASLPAIEVPEDVGQLVRAEVDRENLQTAEIFAEEAGRIASLSHQVRWLAPSRDEDVTKPVEEQEPSEVSIGEAGTQARVAPTAIQGGRSR